MRSWLAFSPLAAVLGCQAVLGIEEGTPKKADSALVDGGPDSQVGDSGGGNCPLGCDDGNPCTQDTCTFTGCQHTALAGAACDDGTVCNGSETCDDQGVCQPGVPLKVDDGNSCTVDSCDPIQGVTHQSVSYPPTKICASTPAKCPAGYYKSKTLLCDPECGTDNCGYCVNGFLCERACVAQVEACCANDCASACPAGYTKASEFQTTTCGCATVTGPAAVCVRT